MVVTSSRLSQTLFLLGALLCCAVAAANPAPFAAEDSAAAPVLTLQQAGASALAPYARYLEDPDARLTAEQAFAEPDWQQPQHDYLNFGFSNSAYWLRSRITNQLPNTDWLLHIHYPSLDYVDAYLCPVDLPLSAGVCQHQQGGDLSTFDQRAYPHPDITLPLDIAAGQDYWLLLRVQTSGTFHLPIDISDATSLNRDLLRDSLTRGGYLSALLIMGLYNLFLFFSTRERSYLSYSAFVFTFLMFHMSYTGLAFQWLWPDNPDINRFVLPAAFSLSLIAMTIFPADFLNLRQHSPTAWQLFRGYRLLAILILLLNPLLPYGTLVAWQNVLGMLIAFSCLVIGIRFWRRGLTSARFFTIAWAVFIAGFIMGNAAGMGLIPTNMFTLYGYQIGSFIEMVLLSLALGERITQLQNEQLESRKALLASQEEAIRHLRNYEDLYQNSYTGQFQLDERQNIIKANPAWCRLVGVNNPGQLDGDFQDLFARDSDYQQLMQTLQSQAGVQGFITPIRAYHSDRTVIARLSLRRALESESASWVGSAQDITEAYLQEAQLKQLQEEKTQSLRQLVMGVSHEMNTPLGNMRMSKSFLEDQLQELPGDHQQLCQQGLEHIDASLQRLIELNQLMQDAVVVTKDYQRLSIALRSWLQDWQQRQQQEFRDIQLLVEVHSFAVEWYSYPEALEKILNQLVRNSLKHNPGLAATQQLQARICIRDDRDHLRLRYSDNGKGIDPQQQQQIFLPFYTTQRQQASHKGLGLYQTYNLVTELMGGRIEWPGSANNGQTGIHSNTHNNSNTNTQATHCQHDECDNRQCGSKQGNNGFDIELVFNLENADAESVLP